MRRLEVDRARDGLGGLVGTRTYTPFEQSPYEVPTAYVTADALSPAEVSELQKLLEFCRTQPYPTVVVPRELFHKVAKIWEIP